MKRGNARLFTLLAVIIVISLAVDLLSLKVLYNISEAGQESGEGELASLWGGDPLEKINPNITNPQCSSYNSTHKSGCLNTGHCFCDDFYNQCYSLASKYRDQDFATCRSRSFPATINGKYFKTLTDCENAVISATYTDRNNCKKIYSWFENVNKCYKIVDDACKETFGY